MSNEPMTDRLSAEDWAGEMGERWLANLDRFEGMIAAVGDALVARAVFRPGERVLDVGCGGGATSRAVAARVAPGGSVLGLDIAAVLIAEARRRAAAAGLANLEFLSADAAVARPPQAPFDRLVSRFGSMFFPEPAAAFANLATLVRPGGRADFAVWAPARDNPWLASFMAIVRTHVDVPPAVPHAPGPFAFDDPEYFGSILWGAGFREPQFQLWRGQQLIGGPGSNARSATDFVLGAMHFGELLREQPPSVRTRVETEVAALFRAHETPSGVAMDASAWLVTAWR